MAGKYIERLLNSDPPLHREALGKIQGCYIAAVDHAPPTSQIKLERITAYCVEHYHAITPPRGENPCVLEA